LWRLNQREKETFQPMALEQLENHRGKNEPQSFFTSYTHTPSFVLHKSKHKSCDSEPALKKKSLKLENL
jgi:hypothetical protein